MNEKRFCTGHLRQFASDRVHPTSHQSTGRQALHVRAIDHQHAVTESDIRLHHDRTCRRSDDDRLGTRCLFDLDGDVVDRSPMRDPRSRYDGVFAEA